jgi:two-component system cell cycle sensor histidine kinase/response regulator CckA
MEEGSKTKEQRFHGLRRLPQDLGKTKNSEPRRDRAEMSPQESEGFLADIFASIQDGISILDQELNIVRVNPAMERWYPDAGTFVGKKCYEAYHGKSEPCRVCPAIQTLETEQPAHEIVAARGEGGEIIGWMDLHSFPLVDKKNGKMRGVIEYVRDITERERAEQALQASEEKYRLLIQNSNDAIFIAQDGVIKFPNLKAEELLEYSAAELAQIPFTDHIHPDDREMVLENHRKRLEGENLPSTYSFRVRNKRGQELWVEINAVMSLWEGKPATLNFVRDITEKKKLEAQYLQAQKMEAVGTLAGGVAHDFNNLLMGIQGHTSLLLLDTDPGHRHYKMLKSIEEQVKSGADLTWQLLSFARGGKIEVKPADLNALIKKTSTLFGRTQKEISIHRSLQPEVWPVEVDRGQIEQVLLNLYVNAWQAMPSGGSLFLETKNVILDGGYRKPFYVTPGNYVKISVTDNGVGMDEKTQKRIFEPFFTTKEMGRGTGLGLATTYGIIKGHGGFINVYSEKGHGATFTIYLPASAKKIEKEKISPVELVKGKETILLVDDEEVVLNVNRMVLEKLGYRVIMARNGQEAIDIFRAQKDAIDLVILDMIMPGMEGGKAFDLLRGIQDGVRIILSSGYGINDEVKRMMERGCRAFIQKPFDIGEFSCKIRDVIASS